MKFLRISKLLFGNAALSVFLLCLSSWVSAQNEPQMQHMMEMMQKAQACMAKIPPEQLDAMANQARQMEAEIKQLCAAGKRSEAQNRGMKYGLELSQSSVAKEMRKCSKMMSGAMAHMGSSIMPGMGFPDSRELENKHICDSY